MAKLTLHLDQAIVEKAKQLAKANHTSVSAMFSRFVQSMAAVPPQPAKIGPLTRRLSGIIKLPPGKEYKVLRTEDLMAKHGLTL